MPREDRKCGYCKNSYNRQYINDHLEICPKRKKTLQILKKNRETWSENGHVLDFVQPNEEAESSDPDDELLSEKEEISDVSMCSSTDYLSGNEENINTLLLPNENEEENPPETPIEVSSFEDENDSNQSSILNSDEQEDLADDQQPDRHKNLLCHFLLLWQLVFVVTNTAMDSMVKFLKGYSEQINVAFPFSSYYSLLKFGSQDATRKHRVGVCPLCCCLYDIEEMKDRARRSGKSPTCGKRTFQEHPHKSRRRTCKAELLQKCRFKDKRGKKVWRAKKEYCFLSLKDHFNWLYKRKNFRKSINSWIDREQPPPGVYEDVFDGTVWKNFEKKGLLGKDCLGFMLNVDWFQPFKRSNYSVGAMYLVNLNLPRSQRYLRQNVILYGVIPPYKKCKEAPLEPFLGPLVHELKLFHEQGITVTTDSDEEIEIKGRLVCLGADVPACRKLCGFLGHKASLGCSKCKKKFPGKFGEQDCSGFDDVEQWPKRTDEEHRNRVAQILEEGITPTSKRKMESAYGVRYSPLLVLKYIDIVQQHIIDPMHCDFLGIAKKWTHDVLKSYQLSDAQHEQMQDVMDAITVPSFIARIAFKLISGFACLTADQWHYWTTVFSPFCLHGFVSNEDLKIWQKFCNAMRILCSKVITENEANLAHNLTVQFLKLCEKKYGKKFITINMHLACHIRECIFNFGPVYSFWLFSFERYNGILGNQKTNNRFVEVQMFNKFLREVHLRGIEEELVTDNEKLAQLFKKMKLRSKDTEETVYDENDLEECDSFLKFFTLSTRRLVLSNYNWFITGNVSYKVIDKSFILKYDYLEHLTNMYKELYPTSILEVPPSAKEVRNVKVNNRIIGVKNTRSDSSSYIKAYWAKDKSESNEIVTTDIASFGQIRKMFVQNVKINGDWKKHLITEVDWFRRTEGHSAMEKYGQKVPLLETTHGDFGKASFMPVQRIASLCAVYHDSEFGGQNLAAVAISRNF